MLAGCATHEMPHPALTDSAWRLVAIDGRKPASAKAVVEFHGDRLHATAGCNSMGGPWRIEKRRLLAGPLAQTLMGCSGPLQNDEQALSTLLAAAPHFQLEGSKLILRSSGHSAELERIATPAGATGE